MEPPPASPSPQRVEALFAAALERPRDERTAFLRHACGQDPTLYREVESLLNAYAEADAFLDQLDAAGAAALMQAVGPPDEAGQAIGPYRLLEEIGRGGMGVVYLAERDDGQFLQRVALKLVKRGMDTDAILRRFLHERQILASLHHPHIARLLDGGMTDPESDPAQAGRPYFAMEHIEGEPLTAYCDAHHLSIDERLRLFLNVGEAVQHAHRHLVIHRDLKPSNILVEEDETGRPRVKLLDFGIAKLLDPERQGLTMQTEAGMRVLTPEYAAPEQVMGEPVTTATDVYSLGVLLYELLTGHLPYRFERLTPEAVARVVAEQTPAQPSTAAGRIEEVHRSDGTTETITPEAVSSARATEPDRLRRRLSGDLDAIVLTALRKEPERRYPSAEALVEEVRRHLAGLPVQARRDTLGYRTAKFVRRHRAVVAASGLVVLALLSGLGAALWQANRARQETAKAEEVKDFVLSLFETADPDVARGEEVTARQLLAQGRARVTTELAAQPTVQFEMLSLLGEIHQKLGQYDEAQSAHEQALTLAQARYGAGHPDIAAALNELGRVHTEKGDFDEAKRLYQEALALRQQLAGPDHDGIATVLNNLGVLHQRQGQYDDAETYYREAMAMRRRIFGDTYPRHAHDLHNLGSVLASKGAYEEAETHVRRALTLRRAQLGDEHTQVLESLVLLGNVLSSKAEYDEAERLLRDALTLQQKLLGEQHPDVAGTWDILANLLNNRGNYDASIAASQEALSIRRATQGEAHPSVLQAQLGLAAALHNQERHDEAIALTRQTLALQRQTLGNEHPMVAVSLFYLATMFMEKGSYDQAEPSFLQARALARRSFPEEHPLLMDIRYEYGRLQLKQGRALEAEATFREVLPLYQALYGSDMKQTAGVHAWLGRSLAAQGRYAEAEPLLLESLSVLQEQLGDTGKETRETRAALADLYTAWDRPDQALAYR